MSYYSNSSRLIEAIVYNFFLFLFWWSRILQYSGVAFDCIRNQFWWTPRGPPEILVGHMQNKHSLAVLSFWSTNNFACGGKLILVASFTAMFSLLWWFEIKYTLSSRCTCLWRPHLNSRTDGCYYNSDVFQIVKIFKYLFIKWLHWFSLQ